MSHPSIDQLLSEVVRLKTARPQLGIHASGNKNVGAAAGKNWQTRIPEKLSTIKERLERVAKTIDPNTGEPYEPAIGLQHGPGRTIDVEADSDEQQAVYDTLRGDAPDVGAKYRSSKGTHHVYLWDDRLAPLVESGISIVDLGEGLGARIGNAFSKLPPASDGRHWINGHDIDQVCPSPDWLIDATLAAARKREATKYTGPVDDSPLDASDHALSLHAMLELPESIPGDGGLALMRASRLAHEYGGSPEQVRERLDYYIEHRQAPCPVPWTETEIKKKIKDGLKSATEAGKYGIRSLRFFSAVDASHILDAMGNPFAGVQASDDDELGPVVTCYADIVETVAVDLWAKRIGAHNGTLIAGDPGVGKSYLTAEIAAIVSTGRPWPDGAECGEGEGVNAGIINFEDSPDEDTKKRLRACGANLDRIFDCTVTRKRDPRTKAILNLPLTAREISSIERFVRQYRLKVLIIDPVGSFLGGDVDSYRDTEVRGALMPLALLAMALKFAFILIGHTTKGSAKSADANVMGSRAFTGVCRSVHHAMLDPTDPDHILLLPGKRNGSEKAKGIGYRIVGTPGVVVWDSGVNDFTTQDILQAELEQRRPRTTSQQIWAFLDEQLKDGPRSKKDVMLAAMANHFVESSVSTAIRKKEIESYPGDGGVTMLRIGEHTIAGVQE